MSEAAISRLIGTSVTGIGVHVDIPATSESSSTKWSKMALQLIKASRPVVSVDRIRRAGSINSPTAGPLQRSDDLLGLKLDRGHRDLRLLRH
ncbi:hypothetical protein NGTWS0302_23780 [Mycolicibacterium cyprinidarum]|uniref:Uncharacterized protein n=1 Tax=Mycolicibacterium cyprinidarum TaxID=2860311 RepID=A0ABQ4VCF9_9MYCO|nr:hypothetical protein NGTWS0302_23780 [Mycolicibacterium sp. NGTWS0302]GJF13519.1 hypothetical protein NGTWS1803_25030 [Mycolicibacterium sp. NGTWS1803]GJF19631.1 hypothetical protein NGTWS1702_28400 [Mycolicibacterium sp. NGTWSNA01]